MGLWDESDMHWIYLYLVGPFSLVAMYLSPKYRLRIGGLSAAGWGVTYAWGHSKLESYARAARERTELFDSWRNPVPENESGYF